MSVSLSCQEQVMRSVTLSVRPTFPSSFSHYIMKTNKF